MSYLFSPSRSRQLTPLVLLLACLPLVGCANLFPNRAAKGDDLRCNSAPQQRANLAAADRVKLSMTVAAESSTQVALYIQSQDPNQPKTVLASHTTSKADTEAKATPTKVEKKASTKPASKKSKSRSKKRLARRKTVPKSWKRQLRPINPRVKKAEIDIGSARGRRAFKKNTRLRFPKNKKAKVFRTDFTGGGSTEVAILSPGEHIKFYRGSKMVSSAPVPKLISRRQARALNKRPVQAVRLLKDGSTQVLAHHVVEEDGVSYVKAVAYHIIGEGVGRIFSKNIAVIKGKRVRRLGEYEVLRGDKHRYIRWVPFNEKGKALIDQAGIMEWNHWEGVFRVPKPPPTAPTRKPKTS